MIRGLFEQQIELAVNELYPEWNGRVRLDLPKHEGFGDYATSVAMAVASSYKQNPIDIASRLKQALLEKKTIKDAIESIEVVKPGFINISIKVEWLWQEAVGQAYRVGWPENRQSQRVMVEFSSPNIAKPFNVGHLRSTIIGDSIARMYAYLGHEVLKDNHVGDWGTQYGKLAYAVDAWGDWSAIEANPIAELFKLYVRFHQEEALNAELVEKGRQYFKLLEEKDPGVTETWKRLVSLSIEDFGQLYARLGVKFDYQLGESFYGPYLADIVEECKDKGVARYSEGAWLIFFEDEPELKDAPLMIQKSNGTSTYGTRDLAGIKYRMAEFALDKLVIEIGNEQRLYFMQIIKAAEMLGWISPGQLVHVGHGLFMLPTGKMSTRKGETVWVVELIDELKERSLQIVKDKSGHLPEETQDEVAEMVAIGALKYNDLSQNRLSNVVFDKEKSLSLDGNSAPYLQYSISRGNKVLDAAAEKVDGVVDRLPVEGLEWSEYERSLLFQLGLFDEVVAEAAQSYLPNTLANYLFQLAQRFNSFYQNEPILQAAEPTQAKRLALVKLTVDTLTEGLGLLGIKAPARM